NVCLPASTLSNAIFANWDDLRTDQQGGCTSYGSGCGIFTSVSGSAPNRIFNIEWRANYYNGPTQLANFEIRLYEAQDRFDIVYAQIDDQGAGATVGVQRDTGSRSTQYECNQANSLSQG